MCRMAALLTAQVKWVGWQAWMCDVEQSRQMSALVWSREKRKFVEV